MNRLTELRYTLVSEGSSDAALLPILTWLLRANDVAIPIQPEWADLRDMRLRRPTLAQKIRAAVYSYPCELLFVHRDADGCSIAHRRAEIERALTILSNQFPPTVCVIPVRMQEAWLLFNETAIRAAANNLKGRHPLNLPPINRLESLPNPKEELRQLLIQANESSGRRLQKFKREINQHTRRVTEFIDDFTPLRQLSAFKALEQGIQQTLSDAGWI
jgi:hypothetical protein